MFLFVLPGIIILLFNKIGVIDYISIRGPMIVHKALNCSLCLTFWTSLFYCANLYFFSLIELTDFFIVWAVSYIMYK